MWPESLGKAEPPKGIPASSSGYSDVCCALEMIQTFLSAALLHRAGESPGRRNLGYSASDLSSPVITLKVLPGVMSRITLAARCPASSASFWLGKPLRTSINLPLASRILYHHLMNNASDDPCPLGVQPACLHSVMRKRVDALPSRSIQKQKQTKRRQLVG